MPIYTIQTICELDATRVGRKVNCLTDKEAIELAQKMADTGLSLQVWRGDELLGSTIPDHGRAVFDKTRQSTPGAR